VLRAPVVVVLLMAVALSAVETSVAIARDLRSTPRRAVQAYLDATARGDARGMCATLSAATRRTIVHEESASSCPAAMSPVIRVLGHVKIVSVQVTAPTATVVLGDARYSDSGNDVLTVRRVHGRWYLTSA
jgi:hypothetical protein